MRIVVSASALALILMISGCQKGGDSEAKKYNTGLKALQTSDEIVGKGKEAAKGDTAYVLYRGTFLKDDKFFDGNMDDRTSKVPYSFVIGDGMVIKGWDEGVVGMKEGGKRILQIPNKLGYAEAGNGSVPPYADLKFEIELKYVIKKGEEARIDMDDNEMGSGPAAKLGDTVTVHYVGTYLSGRQWDNSRERGKPVTFPLKITDECMPGLIYGIEGMKAGGKRTLVLSPSMAFGLSGTDAVQGNQPLKIVVELLSVNGAGA